VSRPRLVVATASATLLAVAVYLGAVHSHRAALALGRALFFWALSTVLFALLIAVWKRP